MSVQLGVAVVSGFLGIGGGRSARRAAKRAAARQKAIGKANAKSIRTEGREDIRRSFMSYEESKGKANSIIAASGLQGGSRKAYQNAFNNEKDRQLDWINRSRHSRADAAIKGANARASDIMDRGNQAYKSSVISAFSGVGLAYADSIK